jgi:hypothetical protein
MRLCCGESITRGVVETSYLYICMGHTTYMHLNRQCRIVRWMGAIGQGRYLSMCALEHPKRTLSADPDPQRPTRQNGSSCASSLLYCLLRALPGPTGHAESTSLFRSSARCGARPAAACSGLSLRWGSASMVCQLGCMGMRVWRRRGRQVAAERRYRHGLQRARAMGRGFETRLLTSRAAENR